MFLDVKSKMDLKESPEKGVFIKDLTINVVKSVAEMEKYMMIGTDNRYEEMVRNLL
jgi:kinesin family protein 3/17